jgi:type IV secretory pathway VirB10-like protein
MLTRPAGCPALAAGEVAQKQTVRVGQPLVQLVERHMQELGIPLQQPAPAAADAADGGAAPAPAPGAKDAEAAPRGKQAGAAQQAQQQQAAEQPAGKRGQQEQGPSGDALDGDFAGLPLLPQQATGKKGKKRQEAAAVAAAELAESVFGQGEDEQGQRKRKKQPKVVTF